MSKLEGFFKICLIIILIFFLILFNNYINVISSKDRFYNSSAGNLIYDTKTGAIYENLEDGQSPKLLSAPIIKE